VAIFVLHLQALQRSCQWKLRSGQQVRWRQEQHFGQFPGWCWPEDSVRLWREQQPRSDQWWGAAVLEAAAFWSVVLGAAEVGAVLLAAAALSVMLGALGVCAGGFTGALALSEDAPAGLLVVAAGAFALFWSVVGVWLDAFVEAAL